MKETKKIFKRRFSGFGIDWDVKFVRNHKGYTLEKLPDGSSIIWEGDEEFARFFPTFNHGTIFTNAHLSKIQW